MRTYIIRSLNDLRIEIATINYNWFGGSSCPRTQFNIRYDKQIGFIVYMECFEKRPESKFLCNDDPVYKDSCMEFFADFFPGSETGYVNFEVNSKGAMLCMVGKSRKNRKKVTSLCRVLPQASASISDENWKVKLIIPDIFIKELYGECEFNSGHEISGNFYKCGDETSIPHWGSWSSLGENPVDFHQPESFGKLLIDI